MSHLESTIKNSRFTPQKLFFLLLTLQFVIAPFYYQPNFGGEGLYLPYNSSVWFIAVWVIASAALLISWNGHIILPRYWLGLSLLPLGALISGFIVQNSNPSEWLTRVSVIIGGFFFFISLFQFRLSSKQIDQSLYIVLAMGMIAAAYGLFQIHGMEKIYPFIPNTIDGQPIGIFQQINIQASLMATLLALIYYIASRPSINSMSLFIKVALCLTAFVASYNIAASGSRVGLLGASLAILVLVIGRWRLFKLRKMTIFFIFIFTIAGSGLQIGGLQKSTLKFDRAIGGVDADIRWKVYKISWDLFLESPLTGHGLGSFQKVFQEKRKEYQRNDILHLGNSPRFSHPHNELMFWMVEGGLIAIMGIIIAASATFFQFFRLGWQRSSAYAALLIPITLHTQVELPFYTANTHWLLLLFLLFITHQHGKKKRSTEKLSLAAIRLIPLTFIIVAIISSWQLVQAQISNAYLIKYFASRSTELQFLASPINSLYFRQHALYLFYRHKMYEGLERKEARPVSEFISYTEGLLKRTPALKYYVDLINAYNILGEKNKRDQYLEDALGIYEENKHLLAMKEKIESNDSSKKGKDNLNDQ
ncbi:Wzy polymerase domain-containing protein [Neptuniibacter sp.]|uniref:PglL family O-oligosaccharyltransferase n=1 Tax=Neptuniibacter sp. TaxID=1962643 RepID=UPI003B5C8569